MKNTRNPHKGFTLIELLVVIAIIGVLSSAILVSLNAARAKGRDGKRLEDIHTLNTALELYANDHTALFPVDTNTTTGTLVSGISGPALVSGGYIPSIPTDPNSTSSTTAYRYCSSANGDSFTLMVYREKTAAWCRVNSGVDACAWSTTYTHC